MTSTKPAKMKKNRPTPIYDERLIEIIEEFKLMGVVKYKQEIFDAIQLSKQQYTQIKAGEMSFTVKQIMELKRHYPMIHIAYLFGESDVKFLKLPVSKKIATRK